MNKLLTFRLALILLLVNPQLTHAQNKGYTFTDKIDIPVTSVKDQYRSNTCWSFAANSFLEAELLRLGKGEYNLSEMFVVRQCYIKKAEKYVRMQGKTNFGAGGLGPDLVYVWENFGLVPESAFEGNKMGEKGHVHWEMDELLRVYVDAIVKNENQVLTLAWENGFTGILDAYLGTYPAQFSYHGKEYTPETFAKSLGINPADFVSIGSFTHHPFYKPFIIEIPDNWAWNEINNIPIDELMVLLDNALNKGFTVCWDADVSDKGFSARQGLALKPEVSIKNTNGMEEKVWDLLSPREQQALMYDFSEPKLEMNIIQELRQQYFDNYTTTDDHLMHICGMATDQDGKKFYKVKNSYGEGVGPYKGYLYVSEAYVRSNTIFLMLNRDALSKEMVKKLGI